MRIRTAAATLLLFVWTASATLAQAVESAFWSAGSTTIRSSGAGYLLQTTNGERPLTLPAGVQVEGLFLLRKIAFVSARCAGPDRGDLYLALADDQGLHALPPPGGGVGRIRENALPMASLDGDLAGLAWLEGANRQSYSVRYAAWDGLRWSEPSVVAETAPGSQLALAAAGLADGSQLLVWSRFDGHDDEIVAARFADGSWSATQPIAEDNGVPDITPTVVAVPGGALASWSRYDGHEYRVVVAHFDGRAWSPPAWAGPVGATEPTLTRTELGAAGASDGKRTWLTFANSHPRGWGVLELDPAGRVLRQAAVATDLASPPTLAVLTSGRVRLRWATAQSDLDLR